MRVQALFCGAGPGEFWCGPGVVIRSFGSAHRNARVSVPLSFVQMGTHVCVGLHDDHGSGSTVPDGLHAYERVRCWIHPVPYGGNGSRWPIGQDCGRCSCSAAGTTQDAAAP